MSITHDCCLFFSRLAPNDHYLPVLYIDQLGVIYRYLKVCGIICDIFSTVMHSLNPVGGRRVGRMDA